MSGHDVNAAMIDYYENVLAERGISPEGVDWKSREAQEQAFAILAGGIPEHASVLDVGCGLAHFGDFLSRAGHRGAYTGIDISERMVEAARERNPELDVRCVDLLADGGAIGPQSYDVVIACGVFTEHFDVPYDEFEVFVRRLVTRMFEASKVHAAFNMLTDAVDFRVDRLHYASPASYLEFGRTLTRYVTIRHDYEAYFFTVQLHRHARAYPMSPWRPSSTV